MTKPGDSGPAEDDALAADTRPARWFLFAWVSLVYLVGWLASGRVHLGHVTVAELEGSPKVITDAGPGAYRAVPLHQSPLFATAMVLHYLLHAIALTERWPPRLRWAYFPLQAALLAVISSTYLDTGLVIGLTLALCAEAPVLLSRPRPVMAAVACCGAGFAASLAWHDPATVVWNTTDYLSMVLFVIGGALLLASQRQAHARQRRLNAELTAAAARIEELTREAERRRIARDLHDTLSQGLVGVTMQLQAAITHLERGRDRRAMPILRGAVSRAQATLGEARAAIRDLRLDEPVSLRQVLQTSVDRFSPVLDCAVELHIEPALDRPGPAARSLRGRLPLVARVAEEALANIAQHSRAGRATVAARHEGEDILIEVRDDGIGLRSGQPVEARGYGLVGMAERAELAGCRLEVESAESRGTVIRLRLPASPHAVTPHIPAVGLAPSP